MPQESKPETIEVKRISHNPKPYILIQFEPDEADGKELIASYTINGIADLYLGNENDRSLNEKQLGELLCMLGESLLEGA